MDTAAVSALVRISLILSYPLLAHLAALRESSALAGLAGVSMLLLVLIDGLLARQWLAWLLLGSGCVGLWQLAQSAYGMLPLMLAPAIFVAMASALFARSLLPQRLPLIARIVIALEGKHTYCTEPGLAAYARGLTLAWALLLGVLALINLILALLAEPDGVLRLFQITPPIAVSQAQWSWFANIATYGLLGGFFVVEFFLRKRRFPRHHQGGLMLAIQKMRNLDARFWRDFLH